MLLGGEHELVSEVQNHEADAVTSTARNIAQTNPSEVAALSILEAVGAATAVHAGAVLDYVARCTALVVGAIAPTFAEVAAAK